MKLKIFNQANAGSNVRASKPFFTFSKHGSVSITREAARILGIKANDQVQFYQDEDVPENWYVGIVKKDGFVVRQMTSDTGLVFNAANVKRLLFDSVNYVGNTGRVYIGEKIEFQKQTLYTLVTGFLRNK